VLVVNLIEHDNEDLNNQNYKDFFVQLFHHDYLVLLVNIELEHLFGMIVENKVVLVGLFKDFNEKFKYIKKYTLIHM
jgi:hypothetical protein